MRSSLLIQLSTDSTSPCAWALFAAGSTQAQASGSDMLETILDKEPTARLVVLVPTEKVLLASVDLPIKQTHKLLQAAPYALEDRLADDIDHLHFAYLGKANPGGHHLAVVAHAQMEDWLGRFGAAVKRVELMLPDALALPWQVDETNVFVDRQDRFVIRESKFTGCALNGTEMLQTVYGDGRPVKLLGLTETQLDSVPLNIASSQTLTQTLDTFTQALSAETNLLQGAYAPRNESRAWLTAMRWPAALAAGWLLLLSVSLAMQNHQKAEQLEQLRTQTETQFQENFPQITRIVDMRIQAEQALERLRGGSDKTGFLHLLTQVAPALKQVPALKLQGLQFREGALYLSLSGDDLQALEVVRAEIARNRNLKLEVISAQAGTDGVQIRLKLDALS